MCDCVGVCVHVVFHLLLTCECFSLHLSYCSALKTHTGIATTHLVIKKRTKIVANFCLFCFYNFWFSFNVWLCSRTIHILPLHLLKYRKYREHNTCNRPYKLTLTNTHIYTHIHIHTHTHTHTHTHVHALWKTSDIRIYKSISPSPSQPQFSVNSIKSYFPP